MAADTTSGGGGFTPYVDYVGQHNANLNYVSSQQPSQAQLYGGGGFGAQPAHYAALGAAYGRATGGFKPPAAAPVPAYGYGGAFQRAPTPAASPSYGVYGGSAFGGRSPTPAAPQPWFGAGRGITDFSAQSRASPAPQKDTLGQERAATIHLAPARHSRTLTR